MERLRKILRPLEVKHRQEQYAAHGTTSWGNLDIYPVIKEHWTYSGWAYFTYWATAGICISSWTLGSSMIGVGLSAGEAVGAVLVATLMSSLLSYFTGEMGRLHHVGFFMNCRSAFGLWGANLLLILNIFGSVVYFGIQSWFGGQAVVIIISSWSPGFRDLPNTIPASSLITTRDLVGFLIYFCFYVPCIWIPAWKIHKWLYINFFTVIATFAGILGYFIHRNGGAGQLLSTLSSGVPLTQSERSFAMITNICSVAGAYTSGTVRVSDWTRFARSRQASIWPIIIAMPLTVTLGALVGVLVTSSAYEATGQVLWNPLVLLQYLQQTEYTAACRAGTFFAGCGLLFSQIFENISQNGFTNGMDIASIMPRYFSMRRGLLLICVLGLLIQPWRILAQAATFLNVLSAMGVFWAPMTGILVVDFWVVRRRKMIIPHLYRAGGIYWYQRGWHWRAWTAFLLGIFPSMPGLVATCGGYPIAIGWIRVYNVAYFLGMVLGSSLYFGLCHFWPPPGLGIMQELDEGRLSDVGSGSSDGALGGDAEKGADVSEATVAV